MEFDHIDPATKSFNIASRWSTARSKLDAEVAKCQLLCFGCHRCKSGDERSVEHGGGKTGKRLCVCDQCRPLKAAYNQNYKRSRV